MTLNDAEKLQQRIRRIKEGLVALTNEEEQQIVQQERQQQQPMAETDEQRYNNKLLQDNVQKKRFLQRAHKALLEIEQEVQSMSLKEKIEGFAYANDRLPFHDERGDSIGLAMAVTKLDEQLSGSRRHRELLQAQKESLDAETAEQALWKADLESLVQELRRAPRVEEQRGMLETQLKQERRRYRELRRRLALLKADI